jgi:ATP phosphoribosyltransferase regulatory subunit HisZ
MINETIQQIEARLQQADLSPATRAELLALIAKLKAEAVHLPPIQATATDPLGEAGEVRTIQEDVNHLRRSVEEFEGSHPRLVQMVNHLANTLSGLGI